jgi:ABC-type transport system involved in multi-copper enzyme maturation permease subunit
MIAAALRIALVTVRELLYEKVFYLLVSFALAALALSILLSQLTYAEQSKLLLDFMLGGTQIAMTLFSVFMGISLFHREFNSGSVYMVLSKPVSRWVFLIGKYLGQITVQTCVIALMGVIAFATCARFEGNFSAVALFQAMTMIVLESATLTAITYLLAVNAGAITASAVSLCIFAVGHLRDRVNENIGDSLAIHVWTMTKALLPDLEIFNMKSMASYGLTIAWHELATAVGYAGLCVVFYLFAAVVCFNHKDIAS